MANSKKIVDGMINAPQNVRYTDLHKICVRYFGEPRQDGKAKPYQVRQVLKAIDRLKEEQ